MTKHKFAFNPDGGLPRLIRRVPHGTLPGASLVSLYDEKQNLLIVDQDLLGDLPEYEQRAVLRTHEPALRIVYHENKPASVHPTVQPVVTLPAAA